MSGDPIFAPWHHGLGDSWACINLLVHRGLSGLRTQMHSEKIARRLHLEIVDALDFDPKHLVLTEEAATQPLEGYDVWASPFLPTRVRWRAAERHRFACYQLDGISSGSEKNLPREHEAILLRMLSASGFEPIRLGSHLSIAQCIRIASQSAFFVGVDSGMSHLCHSVGVPMFLIEHKLPVVTCHRGKAYIPCRGLDDFLRHKYPTWVDCQRFINSPDSAAFTLPVGRKHREALEKSGQAWEHVFRSKA
jgi:hypothetical protein